MDRRASACCLLAEWCFRYGDTDEANGLLQDLWAERRRNIGVALFVGELLEERGDLAAANRWLTAAAVHADRHFERQSPMEIVHLLLSRRRVLRAQGFVDDDLDMLATEIQLSLLGTLVGAA